MSQGVIQYCATRHLLCFTDSSENFQRPLKENKVIRNGGASLQTSSQYNIAIYPGISFRILNDFYYCRLVLIQSACDLFQ
jgi:hypothetical protein